MEFEPLQDTAPNRYAIESDDSEDDIGQNMYPGAPKRSSRPKEAYEANIVWSDGGGTVSDKHTYVAVGQAGLVWASGIELGSPVAKIQVNDKMVANVYLVEKGGSVLMVLQYELPIGAMHTIASKFLSTIHPKSVTIIDSYSSPAYISSATKRSVDPPIRYLQTRTSSFKPQSRDFALFSPPNLILSTSAAFMGIIESEQKVPGLLMMLPLPNIERPPASSLEPLQVSSSWPPAQLEQLTKAVCSSLEWDAELAKNSGLVKATRRIKRASLDESGMNMYI